MLSTLNLMQPLVIFIIYSANKISRCTKILPVLSLYLSALFSPVGVAYLKEVTDASKGDFVQSEVCHSRHVACLYN